MRRLLLFVVLAALAAGALAAITGKTLWPAPEGCEVTVEGEHVSLDPEQAQHAATIAVVGLKRGLPARAVSIALAAAYQESKLRNVSHGDRDSVGLFQQRPSQGWGTTEQIMDPVYSAGKFFTELEKIDGYQDMRITEAAQAVQRSGYPEAYEKHADAARALASALTGNSSSHLTCVTHDATDSDEPIDVASEVRRAFGKPQGVLAGQTFAVDIDATDAASVRRGWALAQYLVANAGRMHLTSVSFDSREWTRGDHSKEGWKAATTTPGRIEAVIGAP